MKPLTTNPRSLSSRPGEIRKSSGLRVGALLRRCAGDRGTSLVEFTVSVPVLFMLLLGFVQLCFAVYSNFCLNEIARDTARWAAVRGSNSCIDAPGMTDCNATASAIQAFAKSNAYPGIAPAKLNVSTTWFQASSETPVTWSQCDSSVSAICNAPGNAVQVVASYPFIFQIPFARESTWNFSSTAQMVIAQ